jgi:hypothetical protein
LVDQKLTQLTNVTTACGVDLLYLAHDPNGIVISAKISASNLFQSVPSGGLLIGGDTNLYRFSPNTLKTDDSLEVQLNIAADNNIYFTAAAGTLYWGTGAGVYDTNLYRGSASQLKTDDDFVAVGAITTATNFLTFGNLYFYNTSTGINFGDNAGGYDTNLYRSAANTLKTDDSLVVSGSLTLGASVFRYIPPTDYTPSWSGSLTDGTITNGSLVGRYTVMGRRCFVDIFLMMGSITTVPTGNWSFSLPFTSGSYHQYCGIAHIRDTGVASYERHIVLQSSASSLTYFTGLVDGNNVNYITQSYPFSWGASDYIRINIDYEIALTY